MAKRCFPSGVSGVYTLVPVETVEPGPDRRIPVEFTVSLARFERLTSLYQAYMHRMERVTQTQLSGGLTDSNVMKDLAWARLDCEQEALQKEFIQQEARKNILRKLGYTDDDFKREEIFALSPVKAFMAAMEQYEAVKTRIDAAVFERLKTYDIPRVQRWFSVEVFCLMTEERDSNGNLVATYHPNEIMNSLFWAQQRDLIDDVMTEMLTYITTEYQSLVKKTQEQLAIFVQLKEEIASMTISETQTDPGPMMSSSLSSPTSIQDELAVLESFTPDTKLSSSSD